VGPASTQQPREPAIGGQGSPSLTNKPDEDPDKTRLTEKYKMRSQTWDLIFPKATLSIALAAIAKLNKEHPFLQAGTDPVVDGHVIRLTWQQAVTGKSVYGWFRKKSHSLLGPQGKARITNFSPSQLNSQKSPSAVIGAGASSAAIGAVRPEPFPHLPEQFAQASFDGKQQWDVGSMKKALGHYGFLRLPGFIPEPITKLAFEEASNYFLGVMRSFQYGFSIDKGMAGFDELAGLPSTVWEKKPKDPVTLIFEAGPLGMTVGPSTFTVLQVRPDGQAFLNSVQAGWVVVRATAAGRPGYWRRGQALADLINTGEVPKDTSITFQPPTYYTPLALDQKWGVFSSKGYQPKLGLGKSTEPHNFAKCPGIMNAQLWMRNILASLHDCLPTQLCWQPDGVSFKAGHPCSFFKIVYVSIYMFVLLLFLTPISPF